MARGKTVAKARATHRLIHLTLLTWVASVVTVAVFVALWRLERAAPSPLWAVGSVLGVGGPAVAALLLGLWRVVRGPRRVASLALVVLATTPLVWSGAYLIHKLRQNRQRLVVWTLPTRPAMFWASSAYDVEARWRYSSRTPGRNVILIDDGRAALDREQLVREMDAHVAQMAGLLGRPVPATPVRWVRGPLTGAREEGRALLAWAICSDPTKPQANELTSLDRHEVAHCVIMMLAGPDQHPPTLLSEGWAEYQGTDRNAQLLHLAETRRQGRDVPLGELTHPALYSSAIWPAYSQGGPFVRYVIERYGPARFLDLYRAVRPESFPADCQRVLGTTWPQLEFDFWQWVQERAARLESAAATKPATAPSPPGDLIHLAPGVSPVEWSALVAAYLAANPDPQALPSEAAFAVDVTYTTTPDQPTTVPTTRPVPPAIVKTGHGQLRTLIRSDHAWLHARDDEGHEHLILSTPHMLSVIRAEPGVAPHHETSPHLSKVRARVRAAEAVRQAWGFYQVPATDPAAHLPLRPDSRGGRPPRPVRIEQLLAPAPPGRPEWTVVYRRATAADPDDGSRLTLVLDPAHDLHVKLDERRYANGQRYEMETQLERTPAGGISFIGSRVGAANPTTGGDYRADVTRRPLTDAEQRELRRTVEAVVDETRWTDRFKNPVTVAIVWPATGLLLALGSALSSRGRARRQDGADVAAPMPSGEAEPQCVPPA